MEQYRVEVWSDGFFAVNADGNAVVQPKPDEATCIDLRLLVDDLRKRDIALPVLLRFQDVLSSRVKRIHGAFRDAIKNRGYGNRYQGLYPIKVNQLHEVVEEVLESGKEFGMGLECGSKAELVATLPHLVDDEMLLVCNGVKDTAMLELIHMGQNLGKQVMPVMEKFNEFEQWFVLTADSPTQPQFGARIKLTVSGSGRWRASSGDQSKFGISIPELVEILEMLDAAGRREEFALLHFHLGSQVTDVDMLRLAVKEISQIYAQLIQRGFEIRYLDVGGGLGVRYDARSTDEDPAIQYGLREYANTVVTTVADVCDNQNVPHPILLSESGRGITAHHSLLVVEVLGSDTKRRLPADATISTDSHALLKQLAAIGDELRGKQSIERVIEAFHQARAIRGEAAQLLQMGYLQLEDQALIEQMFWSVLDLVAARTDIIGPDPRPEECDEIEQLLVDNNLGNFSVFQSMLDHWAIGQSFPIMPLQRLNEKPTRRARLVDLTCDSDGKVSHYVTADADDRYIRLHELRQNERYYLGLFLMGAYQDIMGDTHNLFGRVSEVHLYANAEEPGGYWVEKVIPGIEVRSMLEQVQYFASDLQRRMNTIIRAKINEGVIRPSMAMQILDQYNRFFSRGTYCDTSRRNPATDATDK
ncbi:MAG: biosynthetic arginine decarboxylase [Gammaproteobacteria bacterium]|nr:biosynthetic arginine decarboxylase [Gammaproteobacteria bacterium]